MDMSIREMRVAALQAAVRVAASSDGFDKQPEQVLELAQRYYDWIRTGRR